MKRFYTVVNPVICLFLTAISNGQSWTKMSLPETGKNITNIMESESGLLYVSTNQGLDSTIEYIFGGNPYQINTKELEKTPDRMFLSASGGLYYWDYDYDSEPNNISKNTLKNRVLIYPNPVQSGSYLTIDSEHIPTQILVYNLSGKLLLNESNTSTISMKNLSSGIYIVHTQIGAELTTTKLVVD